MRRRQPWLTLALWVVTAAAAMWAIPEATAGRSHVVAAVALIEFWVVWGVAWLGLLVPRTISLTVVRLLIPTSIVAGVAAITAGASLPAGASFLTISLLATLALLNGATSDAFVDGSSYGTEQRWSLRVPPLLSLTAVPLGWIVATLGLAVPPLAAAGLWILALVAAGIWVALSYFAIRSIHLLSCRWIVLVPAGVVVHDPMTIADAILLPRRMIRALGPALADTDATDLSNGALGLSLQVDSNEPLGLSLRQGRSTKPFEVTTDRIVFTPLRPGALLESASTHRVPIGTPSPTAQTAQGCGQAEHDSDGGAGVAAPTESQTAVPLPKTRSSR